MKIEPTDKRDFPFVLEVILEYVHDKQWGEDDWFFFLFFLSQSWIRECVSVKKFEWGVEPDNSFDNIFLLHEVYQEQFQTFYDVNELRSPRFLGSELLGENSFTILLAHTGLSRQFQLLKNQLDKKDKKQDIHFVVETPAGEKLDQIIDQAAALIDHLHLSRITERQFNGVADDSNIYPFSPMYRIDDTSFINSFLEWGCRADSIWEQGEK